MPALSKRDRDFLAQVTDEKLYDDMVCAITTYRYPDQVAVGDPVPPLTLASVHEDRTVSLAAERKRPLFLIFGSYT